MTFNGRTQTALRYWKNYFVHPMRRHRGELLYTLMIIRAGKIAVGTGGSSGI